MDSFRQIRDLIMSNPQVWRVPCVLAGDVLADTNRRGDLWDMLDDVLDDEIPKDMAADDPRWWAVWLSGVILQEQRLFESDKLRRSEKAVAELLRDGLVALIETPQALEPTDRAVCGRALSLLGDPRLGIGILIKTSVKLPDIAWCEVPGGKFKYGGDPNPATAGQYRRERRDAYKGSGPDPLDSGKIVEIDLPTFYIARYPVTYVQFQSFIDDAEGFHNPHWWDGLGQEDIDYRYRNQRRPDDPKVKYANHPRGNVSWYDAIAFCRWLSWRLGGGYFLHRIAEWAVRLPTDYEWEKAARGTDERIYPYGNDFDAARDNTSATGIGQSSAVGIFPNGASPYGVLDMSGNIAEWCLTNRDVCMLEAAQEDMSFAGPRMYRTVSWESSRDDSRTVSRTFGNMPFNRFDTLGFRLVCARPSMQ
jgi:formylglycine-generating enzyme required for sulfatase activity